MTGSAHPRARSAHPRVAHSRARFALLLAACCAAVATPLAAPTPGTAAAGEPGSLGGPPPGRVVATLDDCVAAQAQAERSATFAGEMTALPGSVRMQMRIDVLERGLQQPRFHLIVVPGLGVWRSAVGGVKVYRYLKQVSDLWAPASYRGQVRFRWLGAHGRLLRAAVRSTPICAQPAPFPTTPPPAPAGAAGSGS
jgi:hypothetical protein